MTSHAKKFQDVAQEPQPYVFDYDGEVAAFYRDWPEMKKKIFFIDASTLPANLLRGAETDEDEVAALLVCNEDLFLRIENVHKEGLGVSLKYDDNGGYDCAILKMPRSGVSLLGPDAAPAVMAVFSFDHEVGHLLCEGGQDVFNQMECIADAYAVIRHFQCFEKKEAASIGKLAEMRAVEMFLSRDPSHFSSPVIEKILADSAKMDFSALTPAETAEAARQYAVDHAFQPQFVKLMARNIGAFDCKTETVKYEYADMLKKLYDFVMSTCVPEEFRWGAAALRAFLNGEVTIGGTRLPPPSGEQWETVRPHLDAREAEWSRLPSGQRRQNSGVKPS